MLTEEPKNHVVPDQRCKQRRRLVLTRIRQEDFSRDSFAKNSYFAIYHDPMRKGNGCTTMVIGATESLFQSKTLRDV